jgi:hypothetical protein
MEQSKQSSFRFVVVAILLILILLSQFCIWRSVHFHFATTKQQSNPLALRPDTLSGGGIVLNGTVLEISNSNPPAETTETNDQLAYIYSNLTPITALTNATGDAQIKLNGYPTGGPVYIEAEATSVTPGYVCARMVNTLTGTTIGDTGVWGPTMFVPLPGANIIIKIYATDMTGNAYSGASVQLYSGTYIGVGAGSPLGVAAKTSSDGKGSVKYGTKLTPGLTYTVAVSGGTNSTGTGGTSYFTIKTIPQSCTTCVMSGVEVFMHY